MAGPRRRAREVALQIIVQMDVNPDLDPDRAVRLYFDHFAGDAADTDADDDARAVGARGGSLDRDLVKELVAGVASHRVELDEIVQEQSRNWRLERMAVVERNVIRLALYEIKWGAAIPIAVAINEAVELAKRFGTVEGGAFVNGLLDRAVTDLQLRR